VIAARSSAGAVHRYRRSWLRVHRLAPFIAIAIHRCAFIGWRRSSLSLFIAARSSAGAVHRYRRSWLRVHRLRPFIR
jgi:hypothetical protein